MDEDDKAMLGCSAFALLLVGALLACVAVGIMFGAQFGLLLAAALLVLWALLLARRARR